MATEESSVTGSEALDSIDTINELFDHVMAIINVLGIEEEDMPAEVVDGTRVGLADAGKKALYRMKEHHKRLGEMALAAERKTSV